MSKKRMLENKIILLALLRKAYEHGLAVLTRIQIHKFLFVSEQKMWQDRILSSGFRFIKMDHGPWSPDIETTISQLEKLELIQTNEVTLASGNPALLTSFSEPGSRLVDSIFSEMEDDTWDRITVVMDDIIEEHKDKTSEELAEFSHTLSNLVTGKTVDETRHRKYLLKPRTKKQSKSILTLNESIEETLLILEDRELYENIMQGLEEAREGKLRLVPAGGGGDNNDEGKKAHSAVR